MWVFSEHHVLNSETFSQCKIVLGHKHIKYLENLWDIIFCECLKIHIFFPLIGKNLLYWHLSYWNKDTSKRIEAAAEILKSS